MKLTPLFLTKQYIHQLHCSSITHRSQYLCTIGLSLCIFCMCENEAAPNQAAKNRSCGFMFAIYHVLDRQIYVTYNR